MILGTNRDLYRAVGVLRRAHRADDRSLEVYLRALLRPIAPHGTSDAMPLDAFYRLLRDAYDADPLPFDEGWRTAGPVPAMHGDDTCRARLIGQVVDLREMDEAGVRGTSAEGRSDRRARDRRRGAIDDAVFPTTPDRSRPRPTRRGAFGTPAHAMVGSPYSAGRSSSRWP